MCIRDRGLSEFAMRHDLGGQVVVDLYARRVRESVQRGFAHHRRSVETGAAMHRFKQANSCGQNLLEFRQAVVVVVIAGVVHRGQHAAQVQVGIQPLAHLLHRVDEQGNPHDRQVVSLNSVSYTHLDVYKRQVHV